MKRDNTYEVTSLDLQSQQEFIEAMKQKKSSRKREKEIYHRYLWLSNE